MHKNIGAYPIKFLCKGESSHKNIDAYPIKFLCEEGLCIKILMPNVKIFMRRPTSQGSTYKYLYHSNAI